ncbi:NmrA family transcriptional regulator [Pedobacter lusitanus]|uniref:NmrA family transcriptional regulator n=1 Tax=Pedobacter lusitanus TaxID=1503925 RepID=A0A0D0GRH0_9SPHI|nr:NAD(P)H-binding protein [Pedobacter lusitanus]KIO77111.1 NmrA family transcriptional regulator [Pedobacter lusitanus]
MQSSKNTEKKILVLGGTGKTGSRVADRLSKLGYPVSIGSRTADIPFDWDDISTWKPALQNIRSVYITFQPDLAVPNAPGCIASFSRMAAENGIEKLVLLSGRGEEEARHCEQIVINSGIAWTIVRASWFFQNFSESYFLTDVLSGQVTLPVGDIPEPFIDADDIADVAVAALTQDGHSGEIYEITGPHLLTFKEVIQEIATAAGKNIVYKQVSAEEYTALLVSGQVPQEYIALLSYLFTEVMDGRNSYIVNDVERALGRKATDFSSYTRKTAASGIWN